MPIPRHGRAAPLRAAAGLTVCLACAVLAAGPTLVPPDEAAALPPAVTLSFLCEDDATDGETPVGNALRFVTHELSTWVAGPKGPARGPEEYASAKGEPDRVPFVRSDTLSDLASTADVKVLTEEDASLELPSLFTDPLPPVVRSQSPDITLLPLAGGDAPIENTSILSAMTKTKGRIRGDYLTDFDETDRIGVQALTQGWLGFGLDAEANYWQRPVPGLGREALWTGDLNLIYNIAPHPRFKFRSGMGAAWTVEDGKPHAGYNVAHGLDVYLLWRAMALGEIDWGQLDDDKLFRYRIALGLTFDLCEIYTGYESYKLGSERLDGWVNGIAFWY